MKSSTSNLSSGPCLCTQTQSPLALAAGVRLVVHPLYMKYASLPLFIIPDTRAENSDNILVSAAFHEKAELDLP